MANGSKKLSEARFMTQSYRWIIGFFTTAYCELISNSFLTA
jgi:hypothetical protein